MEQDPKCHDPHCSSLSEAVGDHGARILRYSFRFCRLIVRLVGVRFLFVALNEGRRRLQVSCVRTLPTPNPNPNPNQVRFTVERVPLAELDPVFNLSDVDVWRLRLRANEE